MGPEMSLPGVGSCRAVSAQMSELADNPFVALTFIAGPAVLTNACATLQNGATLRYGLAISQWREFRASIAAGDDRLA